MNAWLFRGRGWLARTLLVLVCITGIFVLAQAQVDRATVSGTVKDATGAVVSGAKVTLVSSRTGFVRDGATNSNGFFMLPALFQHLGTVRGTAVHTDGIALTQSKLPHFPDGLFVAQSDPESTGGKHAEFYDFGAMLRLLKLPAHACIK